MGEWYKHSIIFFFTDGNKVSSLYTLTKKKHFNSIDRIGQDQTDNASLLPNKLVKLED
jgi:hypothetical protein